MRRLGRALAAISTLALCATAAPVAAGAPDSVALGQGAAIARDTAAPAGVTGPAAAPRGTVAGSRRSGSKLDRSDWPRICVNKRPRTQSIGTMYRRTPVDKANCRVTTVGSDQRERRFVVSAPRSALRRERTPIVLMLHGTSGTGEQYWNISRWRELAARSGFVAVFPSSLAYDLTTNPGSGLTTVWNVIGQACDLQDPSLGADDVAFIRAIVADLRAQLRVDDRRIFVAGFSNGSQMAHRLAAEAGDVFAAAAGWAGAPVEMCPADPLVPSTDPIPVWGGVGSMDDRFVGYAGGELPVSDAGAIAATMDAWLRPAGELFGLQTASGPSSTQSIDDLVRQPHVFDAIETPVWSPVLVYDQPVPGNTSGNTYRFVVLDEMEHHYPNSWRGMTNPQIDEMGGVTMAALHLQFFLDNPKP